jgi:PAS domain-containing protein
MEDAPAEDERASALWSAPFILLVLDDSPQQQLEYSNAAASELFGRDYLDMFGVAGHELIAPDADSQVGPG